MRRFLRRRRELYAYARAWAFAQRHQLAYRPRGVAALPPQARLSVCLLAGQSNMAGHAPLQAADARSHPRVWMLTEAGRWAYAREPLHRRRFQLAGTGPGLAFGKALAEAWPAQAIGLVPCAMGGSAVQHWLSDAPYRGVHLYARLLTQARRAAETGTLVGMLWHQGESNATSHHFPDYAVQLQALFGRLRRDLAQPALPIFVGEIGAWLPDDHFPHAAAVNATLHTLAATDPALHLVPAADLSHLGDRVHFSRAAALELGARYAVAVQAVCSPL